MFGYVMINQDELKMKDYRTYSAYYCGLCEALKNSYGRAGEIAINYDMLFVSMLLDGLYDTKIDCKKRFCGLHPLHKRRILLSEHQTYAADMSMLLMYLKCLDDWKDEHRLSRLLYARMMKKKVRLISERYPAKAARIVSLLKENAKEEAEKQTDIDVMANFTGKILAEVFTYREDSWAPYLKKLGFYLGKFIYVCDAYEDLEKDREAGRFNPLLDDYEELGYEAFEHFCGELLKFLCAECARIYEQLPILENNSILKNILYAGIWSRYAQAGRKRKKRIEKNTKANQARREKGDAVSGE